MANVQLKGSERAAAKGNWEGKMHTVAHLEMLSTISKSQGRDVWGKHSELI